MKLNFILLVSIVILSCGKKKKDQKSIPPENEPSFSPNQTEQLKEECYTTNRKDAREVQAKLINQLSAATSAWERIRSDRGDHYRFSVIKHSAPPAFSSSSETILTVKQNAVIKRQLLKTSRNESGASEETTVFTETAETTGSHQEGAAPKALVEYYHDCKELISRDPEHSIPSLEFDGSGLLKSCGSYSIEVSCERIMDAVGDNLFIHNIEFLSD